MTNNLSIGSILYRPLISLQNKIIRKLHNSMESEDVRTKKLQYINNEEQMDMLLRKNGFRDQKVEFSLSGCRERDNGIITNTIIMIMIITWCL